MLTAESLSQLVSCVALSLTADLSAASGRLPLHMLAADLNFFGVTAQEFLYIALRYSYHAKRSLDDLIDEDGNTWLHLLLQRATFTRPTSEKRLLPLTYAWSRALLIIERMIEIDEHRQLLESVLLRCNHAGESIIDLLWVALGRSQLQHDKAKRGEGRVKAWEKQFSQRQHVPRTTHFVLQWQQVLMPQIQPLLEQHLIKDCAGLVAQVGCSV